MYNIIRMFDLMIFDKSEKHLFLYLKYRISRIVSIVSYL